MNEQHLALLLREATLYCNDWRSAFRYIADELDPQGKEPEPDEPVDQRLDPYNVFTPSKDKQ